MKGTQRISLSAPHRPNVLLLGNGMLRGCGQSWGEIIAGLAQRKADAEVLEGIPYGMQPEALCGTDAESICTTAAERMTTVRLVPQALQRLLSLDFDIILTTNYTYEAEEYLLGKPFTENRRTKVLRNYGKSKPWHNLWFCYEIEHGGRPVQVWHIHGDHLRKHSLVLSFYSYAKAMAVLHAYNHDVLKDILAEKQQAGEDHLPGAWLDAFVVGNVYSVGFGWDFSEIDLWWAAERKNREHAEHGGLKAFFFEGDSLRASKQLLLEGMGASVETVTVNNDDYPAAYREITDRIEAEMKGVTNE